MSARVQTLPRGKKLTYTGDCEEEGRDPDLPRGTSAQDAATGEEERGLT